MAGKTKKNINSNNEDIVWSYGKRNYIVFAMAIITIAIGFITLGKGSITLAPILLVIGYCILIPIALIIKDKPEDKEPTESK